jgi:uncharacterized protein (TIGR02246 family)
MRRTILSATVTFGVIILSSASAQMGSKTDAAVEGNIQRLIANFVQTYDRHDAASVAAFYTQDGVFVAATGVPVAGKDAIEKFYAAAFKEANPILDAKATEIHALGENAWAIGQFTLKGGGQSGPAEMNGHWAAVYLSEGGEWKIRMLSAGANTTAPPASGAANR